jgi:hypothetical protein
MFSKSCYVPLQSGTDFFKTITQQTITHVSLNEQSMMSLENSLQLVSQTYQNTNVIITANISFAFLLTQITVIINCPMSLHCSSLFWSQLRWSRNTITRVRTSCVLTPRPVTGKDIWGTALFLFVGDTNIKTTQYVWNILTPAVYNLKNPWIHSATSEIWTQFTVLSAKRAKHFAHWNQMWKPTLIIFG